MAKTEIMGSWFNSGYHGHFRSKSRNDFICEYRHLAKPMPPKTFARKLNQPATKHPFSKHDNRQSFLNDALIFQEGLGKRRIANSTLGWKPDLLHWAPSYKPNAPPSHSSYKVTFRGGGSSAKVTIPQQIISRPKTSFDDDSPLTTSYRYAHGRDNPNKAALNAMSNLGLCPGANKRQTTQGDGRQGVATCLNWYSPPPPKPASTSQTPLHLPQPPTAPKAAPAAPAQTHIAPAPVVDNGPPPAVPKEAFA